MSRLAPTNQIRFEQLAARILAHTTPLPGPSNLVCHVASVADDFPCDIDQASGKIRVRFNNKYGFVHTVMWAYYHYRPPTAGPGWQWANLTFAEQQAAWADACKSVGGEGRCVAHTCDVANCVRREHIFATTMSVNIASRSCPGWVYSRALVDQKGIAVLVSACCHEPHCTRVTVRDTPLLEISDASAAQSYVALAAQQAAARSSLAERNKSVRQTRSSKRKWARPNAARAAASSADVDDEDVTHARKGDDDDDDDDVDNQQQQSL